ncbi:hypothetical protein WKH56_20425 [Priestia sp. SB1]|uniref:hypothetical protein n=1 Tax=Priestia sp. SB1 TaxID=3132359 RepID=UPI00316F2F27
MSNVNQLESVATQSAVQNEKKMIKVQIPDEIIRNVECKLTACDFAIYSILKYHNFRQYGECEFKSLDHQKLKHKLYISDNRTFKKSLSSLHKQGFIINEIRRLPTKGGIDIIFNPVPIESKKFTQLPATIFNKIEHIGWTGFRLLYYYESYINRTEEPSKHYCFAGQETISKHLGIDTDTIKKYNDILVKHKLLKIVKHKLECTYEYDDLDNLIYTKYNNHYFVRLENF